MTSRYAVIGRSCRVDGAATIIDAYELAKSGSRVEVWFLRRRAARRRPLAPPASAREKVDANS